MTTKKRMLVDASHPEETRIVVTSSNRLDEFDFESANRRQLRGNIYLAKVTRVEPSLQAAFVDYGGNRHGFLAFSEIHPDYYQIPQADRQALLEAEAKAIKLEAELAEKAAKKAKDKKKKATKAAEAEKAESVTEEADLSDDGAAKTAIDDADAPASDVEKTDESTQNQADTAQEAEGETTPESKTASETEGEADSNPDTEAADDDAAEDDAGEDENFDDLGGGEGEDLLEVRRKQIRRYKIQEVIRRGQVLLIQVVKEERGNKGAALTTYLSLAGRYSVLMPNTARGGGISRKITSGSDRKRLKQIASDLEVPQGMGVILRTAGASRTKAEIKRDFEYLSRLWENVRQLTMKSNAPSLVYEEGSLIKRTIRDLYTKDISEVLVSGDTAFREAKDFMQLIMPSHAKNVKLHKESQNLFSRYNVEAQLDSMFSPQVTLPSGGYIVINPTEALVSIDVNSGRATKEHNIEATALQTNLEAAEECARQFRLRDLAGLIVIDFIDMNERRSTRAVEKRLKAALKNDRARIQIGRISHFGLLEMSRQRMRSGVLESSTATCPTCEGTGIIRAAESRALMVMRAIEDHVVRKPGNSITVKAPAEVALYLLNSKRGSLLELEVANKLSITIEADPAKTSSEFTIEKGERRQEIIQTPITSLSVDPGPVSEPESETESEDTPASQDRPARKRRRRKSGSQNSQDADASNAEVQSTAPAQDNDPQEGDEDQPRKRRRRGRRGGRRNRRGPNTENSNENAGNEASVDSQKVNGADSNSDQPATDAPDAPASEQNQQAAAQLDNETVSEAVSDTVEDKPKKPARRRTRKSTQVKPDGDIDATNNDKPEAEDKAEKPKSSTRKRAKPKSAKSEKAKTPDTGASPETKASSTKAPSNGADEKETKSAKPARPTSPLPEEGVIVTTSSNEGEEKPKKKGWWGRW